MIDLLRVVTAILVSPVVVLIGGCEETEREHAVQRPEMETSQTHFDGVLRTNHEGNRVADFHGVRFTIPANVKVSVRPIILSWTVQWPELGSPPPGVPTRDQLSAMLRILIQVRGTPRSPFPTDNPARDFMYMVNVAKLNGPHLNESLNLVEYRYPTSPPVAAIYLSPDEAYLAPIGGERPFVRCDKDAITGQWDGRRMCNSIGDLSANVYYKYEFSEALLPNWLELDEKVRSYVLKMIEAKN